jgi:hypothetical protein
MSLGGSGKVFFDLPHEHSGLKPAALAPITRAQDGKQATIVFGLRDVKVYSVLWNYAFSTSQN